MDRNRSHAAAGTLAAALLVLGCAGGAQRPGDTSSAAVADGARPGAAATCPAGSDTTITLPAGFCAVVFADSIAGARHLTIASNGDVFVQRLVRQQQLESGSGPGGIMALRDRDRDGRADTTARVAETNGTGIALHRGYLYADDVRRVMRIPIAAGSLAPSGPPQEVISDLPRGGHEARTFVIDSAGTMYVNIGSRTNSCQVQDRNNESPGHEPCTELETRAGIWRFSADSLNQRQSRGARFATGIRNALGLAINPADGRLYATQHGRDQLFQNWPKLFNERQSAENPAEELQLVSEGDDFGWPYCFWSVDHRRRVLAPEYGGNGQDIGRCASYKSPVTVFPGHWAPNDLVFYTGTSFPPRYRGGAFIAFHGSWNRAPEPQAGYNVAFVPLVNGALGNSYEVFADGFAGGNRDPRQARHRPTGLAVGPDGALYIADDRGGRIWKVTYVGTP